MFGRRPAIPTPRTGRPAARIAGAASLAAALGLAAAARAAPAAQPPADAPDAIVFAAGDFNADLVAIDPDGGGRRTLTATAGVAERSPDWSPDGRQVAFVAPRADGPVAAERAIWVLASDAEGAPISLPLSFGPDDSGPDWSPDGGRIAFASTLALGREDEASSSLTVLAPGSGDLQLVLEPLVSRVAVLRQPRWSPDGRRLAFVVDVDAGRATAAGAPNAGGELYVVDADGRGARRLFAHPGWDDRDPAWSPDGRLLAFASAPIRPPGAGVAAAALWLLDPATGQAGALVGGGSDDVRGPKWSPDGRRLVAAWAAGGPSAPPSLVVIDPAAPRLAQPLAAGAEPDWARRPLLPTPTPAATGGAPTPTDGPSPAATPSPAAATPTPPPLPGLTPLATLAPFPTLPPAEPTLPPTPPTWPVPSGTPSATATATGTAPATARPSTTATAVATATAAGGRRVWLPVALAAAGLASEASPTATVVGPPAARGPSTGAAPVRR